MSHCDQATITPAGIAHLADAFVLFLGCREEVRTSLASVAASKSRTHPFDLAGFFIGKPVKSDPTTVSRYNHHHVILSLCSRSPPPPRRSRRWPRRSSFLCCWRSADSGRPGQ
jgi:hypothetical protein